MLRITWGAARPGAAARYAAAKPQRGPASGDLADAGSAERTSALALPGDPRGAKTS